ncbi:hypothetical protein RB628_35745 [Streptomyces sp. ADMS]|uniref:hypothetical protein n=1 Tax=Streptomyces sp. ADMS TaxID=3071415 RepID=UPI00296FCD82|nr:hypothetical protein [Streptomyces sp. ADMS]MDW4910540.1 hypothetical protein [Streptomyces sp. ADMS]
MTMDGAGLDVRMAAIWEWCAANAGRFVELSEEESFERMAQEVRQRFYAKPELWQSEDNRVHQLVLRALRAARR